MSAAAEFSPLPSPSATITASVTGAEDSTTRPTESRCADALPLPSVSSSSSPPVNPSSSPEKPSIPISWPTDGVISLDWVSNLMAAFDWSSRNLSPSEFPSVLPVPAFDKLVLCTSKMLHKEPNCVRIDCGPDSSVVVVGDVHGQLHDVLFLLHDAGFPSENRFFVFNGDYVDRGAWGLETFVLLLAWKTMCHIFKLSVHWENTARRRSSNKDTSLKCN